MEFDDFFKIEKTKMGLIVRPKFKFDEENLFPVSKKKKP